VTAIHCPQCLNEMDWSKELLQWECTCGFVIPVDPLLTCELCSNELWWNEHASGWECSGCKAIVVDPLAEDRGSQGQGAWSLSKQVGWLS
jgi:hypothetical protein